MDLDTARDVLLYAAVGDAHWTNLGDDAIFTIVSCFLIDKNISINLFKHEFYNYFEDEKFEYSCCLEYFFPKIYKSNSKYKKIRKYVNNINNYFHLKDRVKNSNFDSIFLVGGGYLNNDMPFREILRLYFLIDAFKSCRKKIYFKGQTIGPSISFFKRIVIKNMLKKSTSVFAREKSTYKLINSWKINANLSIDDVFLVNFDTIKNNSNNIISDDFIIVSIKDYQNSKELVSYIESILNVITVKLNVKLFFISFRHDSKSEEYIINYNVFNNFNEKYRNRCEFIIPKSISEIIKLFSNAKFVLATPYHAVVFTLLCGNIVFTLYNNDYYKEKIYGILDLFGETENILNSMSIDMTIDLIIRKYNHRNKYISSIQKYSENYREMLQTQWGDIICEGSSKNNFR